MKAFAVLLALLLALLLAAGCAGGGTDGDPSSPPETTDSGPAESTEAAPETTQEGGTTQEDGTTEELSGGVSIEQASSGSDGLSQRQVVVAPDAGEGKYLAAFWGEKPTGGYTVEILSARTEGSQILVRLALMEPPPDAMVAQALTYPYAAAVLRGVDPGEKEFVLVTQDGREIGWPVRNI